MKKTNKKLVGGLMVAILVAAVGAVFVSAQNDETSKDNAQQNIFLDRRQMNGPNGPRCFDYISTEPFPSKLTKIRPFFSGLTEEQQAELNETITNLNDQGANSSEIGAAIQEKLDEYGVFDRRLDNELNQTQQRLEILNREKELRDQGYSWDEIRNIIEDEFDLQNMAGIGQDMMFEYQFEQGPHGGPRGEPRNFMPTENSN